MNNVQLTMNIIRIPTNDMRLNPLRKKEMFYDTLYKNKRDNEKQYGR